ncbi:hypothetical protein UFOVP401_5 [uncultured Caudovirales phage]|uniref:Uncharacterized protein n=1 Tax=uncultured Caudovirales phage TaxID=2100421 RepID=A0A6J5MB04_9CAUD|nr:hypothetical protein UFOVP401_5 [uncultured Caudovirales phage]
MKSDIVNRLRTNRECLAPCLMDEAADEIVRLEGVVLGLTAERDEARREVCNNEANHLPTMADPRREANRRGWDCFKEDGK